MFEKNTGKKIITILLALSCIVSGIIIASTPTPKNYQLKHIQQLDSLIQLNFNKYLIIEDQIQRTSVSVDTILTRKHYRIEVPSYFSKTRFHIALHHSLIPYGVETPAEVHFPSTDLNIYVYDEETVLRTLHLTTNPELDTLKTASD